MKLRERIVITLLAITVLLVIPAIYGFVQLSALQRITLDLRARDTRAAQTLGRLRTSLEELQSAEDNYVVLWNISHDTAVIWQHAAVGATAQVGREMAELERRPNASPGYRRAVRSAAVAWHALERALVQEQAQIGENDPQQAFRNRVVKPAFS